jgi:hypothetical protein
MGTRKTIAIVGLTTAQENPLLHKLALNNRLLVVSNHANNFLELSKYIQKSSDEPIELIDCAKDGCWEADIIILWNGFQQETRELEKLQAVATQKIVAFLTEKEKINSNHLLFPHSKVVTVFIKPDTREVTVTGDDQEAVQKTIKLINSTEYYQVTNTPITHNK